ncbi:class I SAM-dependent methyltransferase [Mesorhizobium opportunistum]|uniref:class I SAM-dependent methyltransferase n=1 Tax=Mesorhizobium TaxID=68287 RepID=UPI0003CF68D7|nr:MULTISPECIES: class I SAM-dependent methyltransferase [Mesorhizobium]ESY64695.1 methylase [Mesorhizobium sp. LNHC232B00]WJI40576.1 class I SAM-dependent methyltransferase [Mesorhizobium opportunistum]
MTSERHYEYELGHSDRELKRLATQAALVDPMTRDYLRRAGLRTGMKVLDVGSGAGDVAFLAADIVGPTGLVIGSDRSAEALNAARARAAQRGLENVIFQQCDPATFTFDISFDAIVGRYVLMFSPDPVEMLRGVARHLGPGGVIVFHEVDWTGAASFPSAPTYENCFRCIVETFRRVGTNPNMGLRLHSTFVKAGLPAPSMAVSALAGGGSDSLSGIDLISDLAVIMAPVMEQMGVIATSELGPETLQDRIRAEASRNASVVVGRYEVGAWSRRM